MNDALQAQSSVVTALDPESAVARMVPALTSGGAIVEVATPTAIMGRVETHIPPSGFGVLILLVLGILPGVVYMIWGGKTISEPFSITLVPSSAGTTVSGAGQGRGDKAARYAMSML